MYELPQSEAKTGIGRFANPHPQEWTLRFMNTATTTTAPFELTTATFRSQVLESAEPILIDFWAPWCGPCRILGPIYHEAAAQLAGKVRAAKVNVDEEPALSEAFGIRGIPTMVLMAGDKVLDSWSGVLPAQAITERVLAKIAK